MTSIIIVLITLLFQPLIDNLFSFSYLDEISALFLGCYFLYSLLSRKYIFYKYEKLAMFGIVLFYFVGNISVCFFNYQSSILFGFLSGIFSIKAFISFFGMKALIERSKYKITKKKLKLMLTFTDGILVIVAIILMLDQFFVFFPQDEWKRFGIKPTAFIFKHPTEVACFGVILFLLSLYIRRYVCLSPNILKNYIPAFIIIFLSGRHKAIAFFAFFICFQILLPFVKKIKLVHIIIGIPIILLIGYKEILYYFTDISTARGALYYYSFFIGLYHFPLGAGFGTYGTEFSRKVYSPLYTMYHMDHIYGLLPQSPLFVTDTMWPAIIGETGFIGFWSVMFFFLMLFLMIPQISHKKGMNSLLYSILIYLLIESIADSIFMSSRGVLIMSVFAFFLVLSKKI